MDVSEVADKVVDDCREFANSAIDIKYLAVNSFCVAIHRVVATGVPYASSFDESHEQGR